MFSVGAVGAIAPTFDSYEIVGFSSTSLNEREK
jgi:hypothetical protein